VTYLKIFLSAIRASTRATVARNPESAAFRILLHLREGNLDSDVYLCVLLAYELMQHTVFPIPKRAIKLQNSLVTQTF